MTQDVTAAELSALLRMAGLVPAQTSPLAGLPPGAPDRNTLASLASKGACSTAGEIGPEWQSMVMTLADPLIQATLHIEGVGGGQYFGGTGGVSGFTQVGDGQYRVIGGWSVEAILAELDALLPWRVIPDAPPLRQDFSVDELTVLAALADAHRAELLQACIERRPAGSGAVTRELAEQHVAAGTLRPDLRWLVSILDQFAIPAYAPNGAQLDPGAASLVARKLATTGEDALALGPDLQTFCNGFANVTPFLALAVHAPWADREVALFTRGVTHFWAIEYLSSPHVRVSRVGGRAMEALLRQHLSPLAASVDVRPPVPVPARPTPPVRPAAPSSPSTYPKCGRAAKPGARFCPGCGSSLASAAH